MKEIALHGETQEICLRGIWALYCVGGFDAEIASELFKTKHPWVAVWTERFAGESGVLGKTHIDREDIPLLFAHPEFRSQWASTMLRLNDSKMVPYILKVAALNDADIDDPNIPLLLWLALEPHVINEFPTILEFLSENGGKSKFVANYIAPRVARRLMATQRPEQLAQAFELFNALRSAPRCAFAVLDGIQLGLKGRGKVVPPANWEKTFAAAQQRNDPAELKRLKLIAAQFGDAASLADAQKTVANPKAKFPERIDALQLLASFKTPGTEKLCFEIIDGKNKEELTREAIRALSSFASIENAKGLIERWKNFGVAARVDTLEVLCARADFASALLDACASNTIARSDIGPNAVLRMRKLNDADLNKKIESAWGRVRERQPEEFRAQIEKYRGIVKDGTGDAQAGAKVFEKTCMQCHTLFAKGNHVGPDLTGSNRKDVNYLLENIVDPNAVVGAPYYVWMIKTKDGLVLNGVIAEQNDKQVTLKSENDKLTIVQRAEILKMTDTQKSMMPEGIPDTLKPQEFRDLIKFLQGDGW